MKFSDAALDLLLGASCYGCGAPGATPCVACRELLVPTVQTVTQSLKVGVPVLTAMRYGSPVSTLIIAHKDRQAWQLCGVLGALLLAVLQALPPVDCLVPVPSTPQAERERGYDHTKALALWCGRRMRVPVRGLLSSGVGSDHAKLNANERMREVSGRFRAPPGHSQVILIDDVITTGATAAECVHTLRTAGYGVMGAGMIADAAL